MRKQTGFTLVEIAIVLVIIGLLLGGVLKGQELINSAKVKNLANDFKQVPLFIYGYQDKFKRLPGDDPDANTRFTGGVVATTNGTVGNGAIEGGWRSETLTDESVLFWQHVRLANLAAGSTDFSSVPNAKLPTNAESGRFGIQMAVPIAGMTGSYFACSDGIPFAFAEQLDRTLDDGVGTTGTVRAVVQGTATNSAAGTPVAPAAVAYANGNSYVVCLAF